MYMVGLGIVLHYASTVQGCWGSAKDSCRYFVASA